MKNFFFDFETRSRCVISDAGAVKYAKDPSTEATLLCWAYDEGPIKSWRYGDPIPAELVEVTRNPHAYKFIAHNAEFDYLIWIIPWARQLSAQYDFSKFPKIRVENIDDTQAIGQRFCAGRALDSVAKILKLPVTKDQTGRRLMLKQCKPDSKGNFPQLTPEEWDQFEVYGKMDVEIMRRAYKIMPPLSPAERWAFEWTFKRNMKGIAVDVPLVKGMEKLLRLGLPRLNAEFEKIVGYQFKLSQRERCLQWFRQYIPAIPDMRAETIRDALVDARMPPEVKRALEIKQIAGSASIKKVAAVLSRMDGGRVFQNLVYNGAHTKRWAGAGIQVHNFPRAESIDGGVQNAIKIVTSNTDLADLVHDDIIGLVKNLLRRIFLPDPGKVLYGGDYSKIEPTVLFWLVGLGTPPKRWYEEMASAIYGIPEASISKEGPERQLGKKTALSCGYGQGGPGFKINCAKDGLFITEIMSAQAVNAYRRKYPEVVSFWYQLANGFSLAMCGQTTRLCGGKIIISPMIGRCAGVSITLPSGSKLYYHGASDGDAGLIFNQAQKGRVADKKVYGGLLTEHVTSATSRDIMLSGMFHSEKAGFDVLNTVHDELWVQSSGGRIAEFEKAMLTLPPWCKDLVLTVDAYEGDRYLK